MMVASVPFTFTPGTTAASGQVNQNFQALVNYLNSLSIPSLPLSTANGGTGSSTIQGAVSNLGLQTGLIIPCTASAVGTAITLAEVANEPTITGYNLGTTVVFQSPGGITGPVTIQVAALPAIPLYDTPGVAKTAALTANQLCLVTYSPALNAWVLVNTPPAAVAAIPSGAMVDWPASTPPTGWLVRDGSAISRTTYANLNALAAAASYAAPWGVGDGATTFNLPNDLGLFPRWFDSSGSVDPGRTFGSIQADSIKAHQHNLLPSGGTAGGLFDEGQSGTVIYQTSGGVYLLQNLVAVQSFGGTETRPKNRAYLPIIKV